MPEAKEKKVDFSKVQAKLKNPSRDKTNPHYNSSYVSREKLMEAILPVLNEAGLSLSQGTWKVDGEREMWTFITNDNGFFRFNSVPLVVDKGGPQGMGSGETYASRYGAELLLGIGGTEDDDAEGAEATDRPSSPGKSDTAPPLVDTGKNLAEDKGTTLDEYRARIGNMLKDMSGGDKERAADLLSNASAFQGDDGAVKSVRDVRKLSLGWARSTCHKIEKDYQKWVAEQVDPDAAVKKFIEEGGEVP